VIKARMIKLLIYKKMGKKTIIIKMVMPNKNRI